MIFSDYIDKFECFSWNKELAFAGGTEDGLPYPTILCFLEIENLHLWYHLSLQGHPEPVNSICWDVNGDFLASVSPNLVKIWSLTSGECIQELSSSGNQFYSCVFHPSYSTLLVIGGFSVSFLFTICCSEQMSSKPNF